MIHKLSRATTYLQTFFIHPQTGEHIFRSYATGFFIRPKDALLLVTNWHVVTGLDPATPTVSPSGKPPPNYLKLTVISKAKTATELVLPLYDFSMKPRWKGHSSGGDVDLVIYPLPLALEKHFDFIDIQSVEDDALIVEKVAKEVFILGYPFSHFDMHSSFGQDAAYYMPVWKRGSIATEPSLRLGGRVLLIDALSRAGMSGAPVVIAQDNQLLNLGHTENAKLFRQFNNGEMGALDALCQMDVAAFREEHVKRFRFLGVYSGVIGNSRLAEVALGKCWHVDVLRDMVANAQEGFMPAHTPLANEHHDAFLNELGGNIVIKNSAGEIEVKEPLRQ